MKSFRVLPILALLAILSACQDMDVVNLNQPDRERALQEPSAVEALLTSGFYHFYEPTTDAYAMVHFVLANEATSSLSSRGIFDLGRQPRQAFDNSPTYGYRWFIQWPWESNYRGISNVTDAMVAINEGMRFTDGTKDNTPRGHAFIKFIQGISHGYLAMMFDQAIILDETVNLEDGVPEPSPYPEVMAAAIGYLEEAIQVAEANAFQLPASWLPQRPLTNTELAQWAHLFAARYLAAVARTPAEREQVDWSRVAYHAERAGDADASVEGDGWYWWFAGGWYGQTWLRGAYELLGPADESGRYEAWRASPLMERQPFTIVTSDRRIHGEEGPTSEGTYWRWHATSPFSSARGDYFQSLYENIRWEYHRLTGALGPCPVFQKEEATLLRAEARLRAGDIPGAVELINVSRVGNGKMERLSANISAEEAWKWMKYEKLMEIAFVQGGHAFAERRGWGDLICGTLLHFPMPGAELERMLMPIYTFGGTAGGAATPPDCMP